MLNKLTAFIKENRMVQPGDRIVCAVSGGADSMALLWAMYLLQDKLDIRLSAAHFNHHLRGDESDRDEVFVKDFCDGYQIPFVSGSGQVVPGEKGLEAAARDARYAFLRTLPGKIATAHTADDNAETLLMHMVRGTGLKGLGGIAPQNGVLIRPMLSITRQEVEAFLEEYSIAHIEDSSNGSDDFLRNRLRHSVMPLLYRENPSLAQNLTAMAIRLRQDEEALATVTTAEMTRSVAKLRTLSPGIRRRVLANLLLEAGVKEPEAVHVDALEALVFSDKPSARASFPAGVVFTRLYDSLEVSGGEQKNFVLPLKCPGVTPLPHLGLQVVCSDTVECSDIIESFRVKPIGNVVVRSRQAGDSIRLTGGTKSLKKLFIDRKIPAERRNSVPVIADDAGILGVLGFGGNLDRISDDGIIIYFKQYK